MRLCVFKCYIDSCRKIGEYPTWEGFKRFYYKLCGGHKDG